MRAFIVGPPGPLAERIRSELMREGYSCPTENIISTSEAVVLFPGPPDLVVLVASPDPERVVSLLGHLPIPTGRPVLVVGPTTDAHLVIRAMRAGAVDYIDETYLDEELAPALQRCRATSGRPVEPGRVIAVLAPCGGVGSSTVAANLAFALGTKKAEALLVDLKLFNGDLPALLDLQPKHDLAELCTNTAQMDHAMLERSLARHPGSGVELLATPQKYGDIPSVTADGVRRVLMLARSTFRNVIVDVDYTFSPEQTEALRAADVIILVLRLDFACLRNARRVLDHLEQLGIDRQRVQVVVNRHGQPQEVPEEKAETALGVRIARHIPDDPKAVNRAINDGVPVIRGSPSARVTKSLLALAASLNGRAHT